MSDWSETGGLKTKLRKCPKCKKYTFRSVCPLCRGRTINPEPPRFSPIDKYGKYRRKLLSS